ncbi:MAG: PAS domain S-box protein [Bacteroidetes bacterium]|nr:PAS domain S-box protein [Bacteroidota bacterium]
MSDFVPGSGMGNLQASADESQWRYRALVLATSDMIYRMSPDWSHVYALNGKGILNDVAEPNDRWMEIYIHPLDRQMVKEAIEKAISTRSAFELEHRVLRSDGTTGWTFSRTIPVFDDNNNLVEWFGAANDITARKNIEKELEITRGELEISKGLYEAVINSTPDLVYVFNLNYRFTYANNALLKMWGKTKEEAFGRGLRELGYEEWHALMHEREIDTVVATKQMIRGEVSFPHATLGRRMYDYIFTPVLNEKGDVVAVAGTTRDISDLKAAETALRHSEELFRTLTQSLPQLIWMAENDGNCTFFNSQWFAYTGCDPDGKLCDEWFKYCHPEQVSEMKSKWQNSIATKRSLAADCLLRAADGTYNWFYVIANPMKDHDGNVFKWVGAFTNIEEQKAVEERLEATVKERTKALQRSNDDLLQFAHVASHDLKEPLRKVRTFASRLSRELGNDVNEDARLSLEKIYSATDRMNTMIEGVLAYSTLSNLQQQFSEIDLGEIIRNIQSDLEVMIEQKNARIIFDDLPHIFGAPLLIYQLFYNIVYNALKFNHRNRPPVIRITAREVLNDNKDILNEISFSDNGIGFSQEYAEKIFNTFTRLNSKDQYEGTGLGLALCKKIAERHNGTLTAVGVEGQGATFILQLPQNNAGQL